MATTPTQTLNGRHRTIHSPHPHNLGGGTHAFSNPLSCRAPAFSYTATLPLHSLEVACPTPASPGCYRAVPRGALPAKGPDPVMRKPKYLCLCPQAKSRINVVGRAAPGEHHIPHYGFNAVSVVGRIGLCPAHRTTELQRCIRACPYHPVSVCLVRDLVMCTSSSLRHAVFSGLFRCPSLLCANDGEHFRGLFLEKIAYAINSVWL